MTRGGAREGAGRPVADPSGKARMVSLKLPPALIEEIKAQADAEGVSQTQLIVKAVRAYLGARAAGRAASTDAPPENADP